MITKDLKNETLKLSPVEKVQLVELILQSLNEFDTKIENLWVAESEARYSDYKVGKLKEVPLEDVKKRLNK
ncbi:MAG: addiction module protein [Candidatus Delongbacteria bacterium]|nr:addiction module protein [Candidatus Delongbacteria bacterium]